MTTPDPLAAPGKAILTDADVDRMARAVFDLRIRSRNERDRELASEGLWPSTNHQPTDKEIVRAVWEARPR